MKMKTSIQLAYAGSPASAQAAAKCWPRKIIPGVLAATFLALGCTTASAIEFSKDEWSGHIDTTVSYGAIWRAGDFQDENVGKATFNPYTFTVDNATQRQMPGRWSVNNDEGDRNYPGGGDVVANTIKLTSELDLEWRNYGLFTRVTAFYDFENVDKEFLSKEAESRVGKDVRLLDLYVFGQNEIGERYLNWRLGRQVVSWARGMAVWVTV